MDIIIIGAGITGLSAGRDLAQKGKSVTILEARTRIGGRINTITGEGFSNAVEGGAEFVHGASPLTTGLLKEAGVSAFKGDNKAFEINKGKISSSEVFSDNLEMVSEALKHLRQDVGMSSFMNQQFPGPAFSEMHKDVKRIIQGFDAADIDKISALAVHDEWSSTEEMPGDRPMGGYSQVTDFLHKEALEAGAEILLSSVVTAINWKRGLVEVITQNGNRYSGNQVLITIPAEVLKSGAIKFDPPVSMIEDAIRKIETGGVIKFLIEFDQFYWEHKTSGFRQMKGACFIFSDAFIPTWWTQLPAPIPLLTGWLSGPPAKNAPSNDEKLMTTAIQSLAYLFDTTEENIEKRIRAGKVINWVTDPFSKGAYAYRTVDTPSAIKVITTPIEKTIYFAGEAFHQGEEMGTVEAALGSAKEVVAKIGR